MPALNHVGMAISSKAVQQTKEFSSEHSTVRKKINLCSEFFLAKMKGRAMCFCLCFIF